MDYPKISVIVPVYKVEPYLRKCIESIVNQTYENLEIILVDDGSPDNCGSICDEYAAEDSRIKVIHKENGGVSAARNDGLQVATGEWIGFVDGDDWIEPDMYEYLYSLVRRHWTDAAQSGLFFEEGNATRVMHTPPKETVLPYGLEQFTVEECKMLSNPTYTKLYRTELLKDVRYNSTYPVGEDLLFNLFALRKINGLTLGALPKYHYIQRGDSVCHAAPTEKTLRSYRSMLQFAMGELAEYPQLSQYLSEDFFCNELDVCSKIARIPSPEYKELRLEICVGLRKEWLRIKRMTGLSWKKRAKLFLIAQAWPVYRWLVVFSHKIR